MTDILEKVIETLEFSSLWKDSGFLTEDICLSLLKAFENSDDKSCEHYRYGVYCSILEREKLTDDEFKEYIGLCETEFESVLYLSPMLDLIKWRNLTKKQKDYLADNGKKYPESVKKAIRKHILKS